MNTLVFTPTWNEADNIERLVREIFSVIPNCDILVVDDLSPDGTGDIVESMRNEFPHLHILHREGPRGRGWAGIAGYIWGLDHGARRIIEMDADFSHQPRFIPDILRALENADMVIGSRYVPGGQDLRPGRHRHMISRFAGRYQQWMFKTDITDCTSGFRGYRCDVLERIGVRQLTTWGPAILSDVLYRVIQHRCSIVEVPIVFPDRERGESTLTWRILVEGFWNVAKLRIRGCPSISESSR
ncbi:polyprenol monophosphomannose synthase [bacterium]|nr:polyprenol monophosphomannose synthase [candidate division CSSED10-310 bacterium]